MCTHVLRGERVQQLHVCARATFTFACVCVHRHVHVHVSAHHHYPLWDYYSLLNMGLYLLLDYTYDRSYRRHRPPRIR